MSCSRRRSAANAPRFRQWVALAASAGLVVVDDPRGSSPDALVHRADTALYEAKRTDKGTLVVAGTEDTGRRHDDAP